jgi:hypothetical protein
MSSDIPEGSVPPPGARRPSRTGDGGAPVSGALTIVLAIVAVVAGFLILRSIADDDDGGEAGSGTQTTVTTVAETVATTATTAPAPTTPTTPPIITEGATVVVANVSNINGSAGQMTRALEAAGYQMGEATNGAASVGQLEESVIYFDPAQPEAQAVAESVGRSVGGVGSISPVSSPPPVESGDLGGAGVLLMLGKDKAGKSLEELNPTAPADAGTGATTPPVAGSGTTTPAG